jgi:cytoskeletal protein CcmA (bactofilin family)
LTERNDSESLVIDPEAQNIVNRIAAGSVHTGTFRWKGGLLVEGRIEGDIEITGGPLVLMKDGEISGNIRGDGEAILAGTILPISPDELSEVSMAGSVFITETGRAHANITASAFKTYAGAQVAGRIDTRRRDA